MINYNEWINGDDCCHKHNDCGCTGSSGSCDCEYIMSSLAILSDDVTNVISGKADVSAVTEIIDSLSGYIETSAVTTSVSSESTDSQIPTAKAVFDAIPTGSSITIDPSLNSSSPNPVANSAITNELSTKSAKYQTLSGYDKGVSAGGYDYIRFTLANGSNKSMMYMPTINGQHWLNSNSLEMRNLELLETSAITSSVTSASTDTEIPTAKAVFDALGSESGGISSGEVQTMIDESISGKVDTTDFSTHTADTNIHVTAQEKNTWNAKSDFSGSYNDLTDKPTIPTVPTNVSAFNNDAGYITSDALSGKADSSAVTQEISAAVSGKMDTSAFTAYSAATDTVISNKADASSLNNYLLKSKIWCGTQNEYDSIQNKDAETLYLIHS